LFEPVHLGVRLSVPFSARIPGATRSLLWGHPELNYTQLICRTQKPLPRSATWDWDSVVWEMDSPKRGETTHDTQQQPEKKQQGSWEPCPSPDCCLYVIKITHTLII